MDQKIKNIMRNKNKGINLKHNYIYLQMENEFLENEKNIIKERTSKRKSRLISPKETEIANKKFMEAKNKMLEKAEKRKKELHKLWHSHSLVLQKLRRPVVQDKTESENIKKSKMLMNWLKIKKNILKKI